VRGGNVETVEEDEMCIRSFAPISSNLYEALLPIKRKWRFSSVWYALPMAGEEGEQGLVEEKRRRTSGGVHCTGVKVLRRASGSAAGYEGLRAPHVLG
jgi:hypothetical protein